MYFFSRFLEQIYFFIYVGPHLFGEFSVGYIRRDRVKLGIF